MKLTFITEPINELRAIRLGKRAFAALQAGDYGACEELNHRALAIMERSFGDIEQTAVYTTNLANVLDAQGRWSEAVPFRQRSVAILEKTRGTNDLEVAVALANLANAYFESSKHEEAATLYKRALAIYKSQDHPLEASILSFLAALKRKVGNAAEADRLVVQAEAILSKHTELQASEWLHPNARADGSN